MELARLRLQMFADMGETDPPEGLLDACIQAFAARAADPDFAAFVVDAEHRPGQLLAAGAGWVETRLPGPRRMDGRTGHVQSMCTDPAARRQGHARRVFAALLDFFAEQGVRKIELHATPEGAPLYASFGFAPEPTAMALRLPSDSRISS